MFIASSPIIMPVFADLFITVHQGMILPEVAHRYRLNIRLTGFQFLTQRIRNGGLRTSLPVEALMQHHLVNRFVVFELPVGREFIRRSTTR